MTVPALKVEIAFASTALETAPVWTDVTSYVRTGTDNLQIKRGRDSELNAFSAGMATLTLSNRDRRFDPTYASGPYYGNLKPGKQIRITCTYSGTTYNMFRGWVSGWPQRFSEAGLDAVVQIECYDAIGWAARNKMPSDLIYDTQTAMATPTMFLRETDQFYWLDVTGNGNTPSLLVGTRSAGGSILDGSNAPSVGFNGTTIWLTPTELRPTADAGWSLTFGLQSSTNKDQVSDIFSNYTESSIFTPSGSRPNSSTRFTVSIDKDGRLDVRQDWTLLGVRTIYAVTTDIVVGDSQPHWIAITGTDPFTSAATDIKIYVDGVLRPLTYTSTQNGSAYPFQNPSIYFRALGSWTFSGTVQDVAWHNGTILTAAQIEQLGNLYFGVVEEWSYNRLNRVLDDAGWPTSWRDISGNTKSYCGRLVYGRRPVIDLIQEVERTEQGRLFAKANGNLCLLQRYHAYDETRGKTSQATLSDDGADVGYTSLAFTYDDLDVTGDVTVTCAPYGAGHAENLSVDGSNARKIDTVLPNPYDAADLAAYLVNIGSNPQLRVEPMQVKPEAVTGAWPTMLSLELGDRVTFQATPMAIGSQTSKDMTLEQIGWDIVAGDWTMTVGASPIPTNVFVLDSSALDSADVLGG